MSRWYRAYAGTVKDDKLAEVSVIAGCSRSVAIAVWHAILESAAETGDGGRFETTPRRVAAALCESAGLIEAVVMAMEEIGMLRDGSVSAWKARQYESDNSTERSRKHRERRRNGDATLQGRSATPPDTDTDTDTEDTASAVSAHARLPYDEIEAKCRKAADLEADPNPGLMDLSPIVRFLDAGADLDRQIIPIIRAKKRKAVRSWKFFVPMIEEALAENPASIAKPIDLETQWRNKLKRWTEKGDWPGVWGDPPGHPCCTIPAAFIAAFNQPIQPKGAEAA